MPVIDVEAFQLTAPPGYSVKMMVLIGPEEKFGMKEQPFLRNIVIARDELPANQSPEDYVKNQMGQLMQAMQGFQRLKTGVIEIGGQSCPFIEARCIGPGGVMLNNLLAYVIKDKQAYTISASHLTGPRFDAARGEFEEVMRSFAAK